MGATPLKAVTNCFPQGGGTEFQRLQGSFLTPPQGKPLPPMTPQKPPSVHKLEVASVLSEETGKKMFRQRIKHYHQWLPSVIHLKTQASPKVEASDRLSRLNAILLVERFKIKTPESTRASLSPGEWVSPIDLSDAYLHIPIHPNSRKYLRFCHKSQVFQFTSLPFRLATGPQVFTTLVKEVKLMAPPVPGRLADQGPV